ncbi:MAG: MarR family winged helix-turn-helix transcriptional regulator [Pikeienuella sp.]|uniref:MarR family winged helix-turn-helix transcriptional regulator n=1 Tax=Pikeienuella sp. TaxID=2831957 RepID=UPI00391A49E9
MTPEEKVRLYFGFFNEVGIINQLSRAVFEGRLPPGVTVSHFTVLNHLIRVRDGQTPMTLSLAFQVPKTTMSHTLAGLVSRGLVDMRPNPADGRSKRVWITEAGRAFREEAILSIAPDILQLSQVVEPDRVAALMPALQRIREAMDAERLERDGLT